MIAPTIRKAAMRPLRYAKPWELNWFRVEVYNEILRTPRRADRNKQYRQSGEVTTDVEKITKMRYFNLLSERIMAQL